MPKKKTKDIGGHHETSDQAADDYKVGHGRPPKETQFKKGQSGNPNGRPKKAAPTPKSAVQMSREALSEKVLVTQNNQQVYKTKEELMYIALANKAAKGERGAVRELMALGFFDPAAAGTETPEDLERKKALVEKYIQLTDQDLLRRQAALAEVNRLRAALAIYVGGDSPLLLPEPGNEHIDPWLL